MNVWSYWHCDACGNMIRGDSRTCPCCGSPIPNNNHYLMPDDPEVIAALEIAEVGHLRFDNLRFMLHFPAFDLKFTSRSNPQLHGYRNVIDVAELDVLLQWYKERKESYGR